MKVLKIALWAAALAGGASAASAQQSAAAFVRGFYRQGAVGNWRHFVTPDTVRLQHMAERRSRQEIPQYLDADPVCTCQDDAAMRILSVRTAPARGGLTQASVTFEFIQDQPEPARTVRFLLQRSGRGWRIHDILFPFGRRTISYRAALMGTAR